MTKFSQLTQAEHMYIYDKKSLAEIGIQLGLSRRILFYWKKEYNWDKKLFDAEHNKDRFSEELLEFARKMMNKISADIDKTCNFQVRRLSNKTNFTLDRIIMEV